MEGMPSKLAPAPYGLSDCWEYAGAKTSAGYGYPTINGAHVLAHRLSWEWTHKQKIPKGKLVRHRCDNRLCINPEHLLLGTQQDNIMDMVGRGRHGNSIKSALSCRKGHPRNDENTYIHYRWRNDKWWLERTCRVCKWGKQLTL